MSSGPSSQSASHQLPLWATFSLSLGSAGGGCRPCGSQGSLLGTLFFTETLLGEEVLCVEGPQKAGVSRAEDGKGTPPTPSTSPANPCHRTLPRSPGTRCARSQNFGLGLSAQQDPSQTSTLYSLAVSSLVEMSYGVGKGLAVHIGGFDPQHLVWSLEPLRGLVS